MRATNSRAWIDTARSKLSSSKRERSSITPSTNEAFGASCSVAQRLASLSCSGEKSMPTATAPIFAGAAAEHDGTLAAYVIEYAQVALIDAARPLEIERFAVVAARLVCGSDA